MPTIFNQAWFWLLMAAIVMFLIGVILLAVIQTGWGVALIILGIIFLIAAAIVGFISSSHKATVDLLNSQAGTQLVSQLPALIGNQGVPLAQTNIGVPGNVDQTANLMATVTSLMGNRGIGQPVPVRGPIMQGAPINHQMNVPRSSLAPGKITGHT